MGNAHRKTGDLPDELTGLTEKEVNLVQQTWRTFSRGNHECGVRLFLALFLKHPEYIQLFKNFRGKPVAVLKEDPAFRAHGCSIGYHITSMVESLRDHATFEILVRRNATEHLRRKGVKPFHFEVMGQCLVDELQTGDERHMTPAAIDAWGKFLTCMVAIIKDVYAKAAADRAGKASLSSGTASERYSRSTSIMDDAIFSASPFGTAAEACLGQTDGAEAAPSASLRPAGAASGAKRPSRIIGNLSAGPKKSRSRSDACMPTDDGALRRESCSAKDTDTKDKSQATEKRNARKQKH